MKRVGNIYNKICDMGNIKLAYINAKKGKSHYKEVRRIDKNPDLYLELIRGMLVNKTFKNSKYKKVTKKTDSGKVREIMKLPFFPDRIIHHCIMNVIEPIWYKTLIRDTYSAIKGRGIHDGVKRIKKALRDENTKYCLKLDVKKFYPSIKNEIMKQIIRRKIKDADVLWLLDEIIDSTEGMPIGNYLSQYFGNLYLSYLDHEIKEKLRIKYYFRYCDDIVILSKSKKELWITLLFIRQYLSERLKLEIKDNWQIFPIDKRGIDFLGYRFFHGYVLVRKRIIKKFKRRIAEIKKKHKTMPPEKIINSIMSYWGWLKYANCKNLFNKYIDDELFFVVKITSKKIGINNPLQGLV